ncbi:MAG TPA: phenylalanine--tRNA ligase subunit beta [Candidatus Paceibacterota bacterium]|nr:phenylalanine--tRNA ligase subunit beta [Candidatus Paceibacterota bacterium]
MKVSRNWLQNYFADPLPSAEKIADALTFHAFEIEGTERAGSDDVIDVKVTPNRGHDALSHRGIAKELSAILQLPMKPEVDPFAKKPDFSKKADAVSVTIEDAGLCRRYIAGHITGVTVGQSPDWLRQSLESIGQRSINNIVDATNLVMFDIGQPLHAFDAAKLGSLQIGVRHAREGERLDALDDKTYALTTAMLVITAGDVPVGIAGVKGGKPTGIDETTTDIILEAANFNGPTMRRTAAALKLSTDASQRFQQVLSPELAGYGMQQAVELITAIAGGEVRGFVDEYPNPAKPQRVSFSATQTSKLLGISVSPDDIKAALQRLDFAFEESRGAFSVDVPFERLDLTIPEDLIEEVGRLIGYEKIPAQELPASPKSPAPNENFAKAETIREQLLEKGYSEVYTSVFADKGEVAVLNKIDSVRPFLRSNLLDGLTEAVKKNIPHKDLLGLREVKLFEIGTVWKDGKEEVHVASVGEKEKPEERPLADIEAGSTGELPLSKAERYYPFSRYPSITRDIALWTPADTDKGDVRHTIVNTAGPLLVRIDFFDEFKKDDKISYAYRLVFQSPEKTLTDDEINGQMDEVYAAVKSKGWTVR